jgi:hypothetical protein
LLHDDEQEETYQLSIPHESMKHFKVKAAVLLYQLLVKPVNIWPRLEELD